MKHRVMVATALLTLPLMLACSKNDNKQLRPTAEQQQRTEQNMRQTNEEIRKLTTGEGASMLRDSPRPQPSKPSEHRHAAPLKKQPTQQEKQDRNSAKH